MTNKTVFLLTVQYNWKCPYRQMENLAVSQPNGDSFKKDETNIRKHINNIFNSMEVDLTNNTQKMQQPQGKYNKLQLMLQTIDRMSFMRS